MKRRQYLVAMTSISALGLAGCSGSTSGNNSSNASGGSTAGGGSNASGDSTASSSGDTESETATESEEETTVGAEDTATSDSENESEVTETQEQATTASGNESSNSSGSGGGSASISDSGDTDVTLKNADVADVYSLDSVAFYSKDMSSGVRGEVTNTSDSSISYTGIQVKFYDSEGTRLGEGLDNTSDLGAGETYAFDAISLLTGDKLDSIAAYSITVTDSVLS